MSGSAHHGAFGLLDRAWHTVHVQTVAVDRDEMIGVVAEMIVAMARR